MTNKLLLRIGASIAAVAAVLLSGCATQSSQAPSSNAFSIAVIGDLQYNAEEERLFPLLLQRIDREPVKFVVHLGDFKAGSNSPCTDALFLKRRTEFNQSRHPFIYTTGDNDWVDCRRPTNGPMDPLERLQKLREVFFSQPTSLGQTRIALERQSDVFATDPVLRAYSDNLMWEHNGFVFVTLNIQGSNDNAGFDAASDAEQRLRERANTAWLDRAMARAAKNEFTGLVLFMQANVGFENSVAEVTRSAYAPFLRHFEAAARRFAKPILFTHGDTHKFRVDRPFVNPLNKQTLENVIRLEGHGSTRVNWVRVTLDPANRSTPFAIENGGFTAP